MLAQQPFDHRLHPFAGRRNDPAAQQVAAVGIAHRQRVAALSVTGAEPALEVHAPGIVGLGDARERPGLRQSRRSAPATRHQAFAAQQVPDRAGRWPPALGLAPHQSCPQLARSPARVMTAQGNDHGRDIGFDLVRRVKGHMRSVRQPTRRIGGVTPRPLVAGLAADPVTSTQAASRLLAVQPRRHELHAFIHRTGLPPRHRQPSCRLEKPVTHPPGLVCYLSTRSVPSPNLSP